jgi:hypothetical protein
VANLSCSGQEKLKMREAEVQIGNSGLMIGVRPTFHLPSLSVIRDEMRYSAGA